MRFLIVNRSFVVPTIAFWLVLLICGTVFASDIERGEYVTRAAGCITCHTDKQNNGKLFSGGREIKSPYGFFYSTNITPDTETGIGGWSDADFIRALKFGKSPNGKTYYPIFPYTSYRLMTDDDILAIKAYLFKQKPIHKNNRAHELRFPFSWRFSIYPWRWLFFSNYTADYSTNLDMGKYLVEALGHCAECHTARNMLGGLKRGLHLAGTRYGMEEGIVPNITPDFQTGIGDWSVPEIVFFLRSGLKPNGDDIQGHMREVIEDGLRHLTDEDLEAIAVYLKSVPSKHNPVNFLNRDEVYKNYDEW